MNDQTTSFPALLQRFFMEYLNQQRAVSPQTVKAYRDTFRLLLNFAKMKTGKTPSAITLNDLNAKLLLEFLEYLEKERGNSVRSRIILNIGAFANADFIDITAQNTVEPDA